MSKVLVFESDAAFAEQLKTELEALSHQVTVTDDPSAGLQTAAAERPDLILLAVELPRMSGFSVCGKLKRDNNLKTVPVIILSADASEETFEQHRRLRTRAEVYVKKPVSFAELRTHIAPYVSVGESTNDDEVLIDDEVDFVDADVEMVESQPAPEVTVDRAPSEVPQGELPQSDEVLSDGASFAEQALGAILADEHAVAPSSAPPPSSSKRPSSDVEGLQQQLAITQAELDKARSRLSVLEKAGSELEKATAKIHDLEHSVPDAAKVTELQSQLSQLTFRAEQAESKVNEYENKLRTSPKSEDLQRLQKDLDDTRAKGGATARDFLELREQINRKDKEMLDLRDQVTSRDKELLNLRDANLAQERAQADMTDRMAEVDKQLHELQRGTEAAKADKEQAAKRAEDYKKRSDKLAIDVEALTQERKAEREKHESDIATRKASEAALKASHEEAIQNLLAEQDAKIAAECQRACEQLEQSLRAAHEQALNDKDAALIKVMEEKSVALAQAEQTHAQTLVALREEAELVSANLLKQREQDLTREHDNTLAALHRANEAVLEQQRNEQKAAIDKLTQDLAEAHSRHDRLRAAWDENSATMSQMREALQAALGKMNEIGGRSVD